MNKLIDSKRHEDRLLIKCRKLEKENRQLIECRLISTNKKIDNWLSLSLIHDHFRKLTIRQMKIKCNHRFQKENFFINVNSRSFSLIHDAHNESEMHSSFAKIKFRRFVDLKMFYVNFSFNSRRFVLLFRDFSQKNFRFVKIRFVASFTKIRFVVSSSLNKKISIWRFYLTIRVLRRAIYKSKIWSNVN